MKRFLCPQHIHHLKVQGKTVQLSTPQCNICRWAARPLKLEDLAREFENIACSLRMCAENPDYDPIGISYMSEIEKMLNRFVKGINKGYLEGFMSTILKGTDYQVSKKPTNP